MSLSKYFKPDQKLLLTPLPEGQENQTIEYLTTFLVDSKHDYCDLRLPYGKSVDEQFPFKNEMQVELMGDALGLGIKVHGHFDRYLDTNTIRIRINPNLEMFKRRYFPRSNCTLGIRYTKGRGTLRSYREQWLKNVQLLDKAVDLSKLRNFPRLPANISSSGIRIPVKPPIAEADLCLLLIELGENAPPVCALAEVVWISPQEDSDALLAGMQFIKIRKSDQQRIAKFLNQRV